IHTAIEIHKLVEELSPKFEKQNLGKLSMHTGINTGLVITGDKYIGKGRQGLAGDTINIASRLTGLAKSGEIVIGPETYKMAMHHFSFDPGDPVHVKGKKDPIKVFKINDSEKHRKKKKQLKGVQAELVGRDNESIRFGDVVKSLKKGTGSVLCLYGTAGIGKSRLVEEFKAVTNVYWLEGYTYPYTKNISYFPIIALFDQALSIKDDDSSENRKSKIEKGIGSLIQDSKDIIPYIGKLYSLDYPEIESVSPEFFKSKLFDAVYQLLKVMTKDRPTIICFEDLHWADPSSLELIHFIHSKFEAPVIFLYVTRPVIRIFSEPQIEKMNMEYHEINLKDLSASDSKMMVQSLLKTKKLPSDLELLIEKKTQGNPFYLEEIINSLIESKVLVKNDDAWELKRKIVESDISSSIHGVIAARVDRLESDSKRILQEASVIGRSFYYEIINKINETKKDINICLETLEGFDFIKAKANENQTKIDLEYIFKHALTQEVVYNGLLKAQRKIIHEKIGTVIEAIFHDRLPEFYETLAHHFLKGSSTLKAVDYLIKSGDKSLQIYSLDESNDYFQKAFDLLDTIDKKTAQTNEIMIDLLIRWALVFYYNGTFYDLGKLLSSQEHLIANMEDNEIKGMFIAWQGYVLNFVGKYVKSETLLKKALDLGTRIDNKKVTGYACTWLAWVCADLGFFERGIEYGKRANKIAEELKQDHYLYYKSLAGIGYNYSNMGYASECIKIGEKIVLYGNRHSQTRCIAIGYFIKTNGYMQFGNFNKAIASGEKAVTVSADPFYKYAFSLSLNFTYLLNNDVKKTEELLRDAMPFFKNNKDIFSGDLAAVANSMVLVVNGRMAEGLKIAKKMEQTFTRQKQLSILMGTRFSLGKVYLKIIQKTVPISILTMLKNIGFIIQNVPTAYKKAIYWYSKTIEIAEETGALGKKAQALLDLGILYRIKKQNSKAKEHLEKAIELFEEVGAYAFLKQAKEELHQLNK
nr:AAA family ATPase [Deltaproteobacteria bacterium]